MKASSMRAAWKRTLKVRSTGYALAGQELKTRDRAIVAELSKTPPPRPEAGEDTNPQQSPSRPVFYGIASPPFVKITKVHGG